MTGAIIGPRTVDHLTDNLGATGWSLDAAHGAALDAASDYAELPYPYLILRGAARRSPA